MFADEYSPEGYAQREARDSAADETFGSDWREKSLPREQRRYVPENDVEGGYPDSNGEAPWNPPRWYSRPRPCALAHDVGQCNESCR